MQPLTRICALTGELFVVDAQDQAFVEKVSPILGGVKLLIPPPTLAPNARQMRRLAFRNERYLYRNNCFISKRPIVSVYSPDKQLKVCAKEEWLKLDNIEFGRKLDFKRPFFEQFADLYRSTFKVALMQAGDMENSEYAQFCGWLKNCYWVFDMGKSEDCMYGVFLAYCKDCVDGLYLSQCELCYDSVRLENCYEVHFSGYSTNCHSSSYLYNCIGCRNCIACANLRNKEYYIENEYVGKEHFDAAWRALRQGSYSEHLAITVRFDRILQQIPRKPTHNINCENCRGEDLTRSANVIDSYNCLEARDCRYVYDMYMRTHDCYDIATYGEGMDYCYELSGCGGKLGHSSVSSCFFSTYIYYGGANVLYSISCHENSQNLFGCCDLRKKEYCILNRQYSKSDYEALVPRIVDHMRRTGEWGEFFPLWISPFGYNESLADEFYPRTRDQVTALGAHWSDYQSPPPSVTKIILANELPDNSVGNSEQLVDQAVSCEVTGKPFKLIKREIDFYRKLGVPIPRCHPEERHRNRRARWLNPRELWRRRCPESGVEFDSSYPPGAKANVVSEEVYFKALE